MLRQAQIKCALRIEKLLQEAREDGLDFVSLPLHHMYENQNLKPTNVLQSRFLVPAQRVASTLSTPPSKTNLRPATLKTLFHTPAEHIDVDSDDEQPMANPFEAPMIQRQSRGQAFWLDGGNVGGWIKPLPFDVNKGITRCATPQLSDDEDDVSLISSTGSVLAEGNSPVSRFQARYRKDLMLSPSPKRRGDRPLADPGSRCM